MAEDKTITDHELENEDEVEEGDKDQPSQNKGSDTEKEGDKYGAGDGGDGGEDNKEDDEPPVIPLRRNASFIIKRQKDTIDRLRSKTKPDGDGAGDGSDDGDKDDEELTPEAKGLVEKTIEKHVNPIKEALISRANEEELTELLTQEPDAKKFEKRIRAFMAHDSYKDVPPSVIFHHLAFGAAQSIGAKKRQVADKEAKLNSAGGNQRRSTRTAGDLPTSEEIEGMSETEFESLQNKVMQGNI